MEIRFKTATEVPMLRKPHYQFGTQSWKKENHKNCRQLLERQFACSELMFAFMDMIQWILFRSYQRRLDPKKIPMVSNELFQPFLQESIHLKTFGEKSTSGMVRWSEMLKDRFPIILKAIQKKGNVTQMEDLIHEYVVSLYALNSLRTRIPHFSFAFALYSDPHYSLSLVMEWIPNGLTLSSYLDKQLSLRWKEERSLEWISIWMQIMLALEIAQEQCWFTHYDLHADNLILRENQHIHHVPQFHVFHETYQWKSAPTYIPTMIDFAHACVTDKSSNLLIGKRGKASFPEYGMYASYVPGADLLKLILYLYSRYLSERTYDPMSMAERIFRPFMIWILRQFYQIVLDEKKVKQKFVEEIRVNLYNMTRYPIIYYSPYDLIQFLDQESVTACRLLRIQQFPWKKSIRTFENKSDHSPLSWETCFLTQFCSSIKPIMTPSPRSNSPSPTLQPSDWKLLEDYLRQKHHFQYPIIHTSQLETMISILHSSKSFLQISHQIMNQLEQPRPSNTLRQWLQSPWKKPWIYHYRVLTCLSQFVTVYRNTLPLPLPK